MKDQILELLNDETLCVVSTVSSEGKPESAIVAFSETDKLEIVFGTSKQSRKYLNLMQNPHISIVFGPTSDYHEIQYEGVARELSGDELVERKQQHFKKQPGSVKYEGDPLETYLVVTPTWARLVQAGPNFLGELTEFDT